jgi:hypothetical protein
MTTGTEHADAARLGAEPAWPDDEPCSICAEQPDDYDEYGIPVGFLSHCCRCGNVYCQCPIDTEPGPGENPDAWCGYCPKAGHWSHEHATDGELAAEEREYEANQSPEPPEDYYDEAGL